MGQMKPVTRLTLPLEERDGGLVDLDFLREEGVRVSGIKKLLLPSWYGYAIPVEDSEGETYPGGLLVYIPFSGGEARAREVIKESE